MIIFLKVEVILFSDRQMFRLGPAKFSHEASSFFAVIQVK